METCCRKGEVMNNDPIKITGWGYNKFEKLTPKDLDKTAIFKKPVDLRWQKTGEKEGYWCLAEDWKEFSIS